MDLRQQLEHSMGEHSLLQSIPQQHSSSFLHTSIHTSNSSHSQFLIIVQASFLPVPEYLSCSLQFFQWNSKKIKPFNSFAIATTNYLQNTLKPKMHQLSPNQPNLTFQPKQQNYCLNNNQASYRILSSLPLQPTTPSLRIPTSSVHHFGILALATTLNLTCCLFPRSTIAPQIPQTAALGSLHLSALHAPKASHFAYFTASVQNDWNFNSVQSLQYQNMRNESSDLSSPAPECQPKAEPEAHLDAKKMEGKVSMESEQSIKESNFEEGLKAKLLRLRAFIQQLVPCRDLPINPESLEQLQIEEEVYRNVGYETVIQETEKRIQKMTKTRKLKRNWSICDLKILIWLICKHCERDNIPVSDIHNHQESWELISSLIPGTTAESCLFKWLSLKRHKITLHGWSQQEEQILMDLEKKHAESRNKWKYISEQLYSLNSNPDKIYRHPKQCRQHYASFLDPTIKKGPWTKQEDLMLLSHIIQNSGEKKWCRLVKILEGRTENAIKNRFQLVFAKLKKKKENKSKPELQLISEYVKENGGVLPAIKKQRDQAVNNQSPLPSIKQNSPEQEEPKEPVSKLPVIPTFNFFPSSRSLSSAFLPYLHEPLYQQLPDTVYRELTKKSIISMESIPLEKQ